MPIKLKLVTLSFINYKNFKKTNLNAQYNKTPKNWNGLIIS